MIKEEKTDMQNNQTIRSSIDTQKQYRRNYYRQNKEKLKEYQKEYYKKKKMAVGGIVKQVNRKCMTSWKGKKNPITTIEYGTFIVSFD
tara:strand:+ start:13988 stop:14251 length:264 start_codon:yes stop_codon:yes gene_type:complete